MSITSYGRPSSDWPLWLVQPALAIGWGLMVGGLMLVAAQGVADVPALVAVGLVGVLGTRFLLVTLAEPQDRKFLAKVVAAGVLLRMGLLLLSHYLLPVSFFAPDQLTYQDVGWRTLLYWRGQGARPRQIGGTMEWGYFYWNALLYAIFGFKPIAAKLFNCFFGIWATLVAYRIAGELAGQKVARNTAVLTMLFPSLVLWSTQNLRDTIVLLLLVLILWRTMRLRRRPSLAGLFGLTVMILLLAVVRDYMAVMVVFALTGSFLITPGRALVTNVLIGLSLFGTAVAVNSQLGLGAQWVEDASFEAIQVQRSALATGGSAFQPGVDVSTPLRGLQYLPIGLLFFLLAPFPWQVRSTLTLMTLPEMLIWYRLLFFVAKGGLFLLRERFSRIEPILLFVGLTTVIYALVEGNAGTAYRHRAQVVVFLLIFAGVGLELRRRQSTSRVGVG